MVNRDRYAWASFLLPLLAYVVTLNWVFQSDYPISVMGTQWAMWRFHSFSLGTAASPLVHTFDAGVHNGLLYSTISPGLAVMSFPFAALGFALDGGAFNLFGHALLLDELFLAITASLAVWVTYKVCRFYAGPGPSLVAALVLAFGTSVWPFSSMPFIQDASVLFAVAAVYFVLRYSKEARRPADLALAGVSLGVAFFVEYVALLLAVPLIAYLLLSKVRVRDAVLGFCGFLVGPVLQLGYNYAVLGNPLLFPEQLEAGASGSLLGRFDPLLIVYHSLLYAGSPYRGLVFFSPVLAFGAYGLYAMHGSLETKRDSLLFLALFLAVLLPYSAWEDWSGGLAYGPRFLILGLPYLAIPVAVALRKPLSRARRWAFFSLFAFSSFVEGAGALTTAVSVAGSPRTYQFLALNLSWLLEGRLDSWWAHIVGDTGAAGVCFLVALVIVVLWLSAGALHGHPGSDA